jgi:hypothetical protein
MDELLSTSEAVEAVGATYRQLDYWCGRGWIPDVPMVLGSGARRIWTRSAIAEAKRLLRASNAFEDKPLPALADFLDRAAEAGVKP